MGSVSRNAIIFSLMTACGLAGAETIVVPSSSLGGASDILPVVTEGAVCTASPSANTGISADYSAILTCQSGKWQRPAAAWWREPVANYASLPTTNNKLGEVRITLDTKRAFVWNGASWAAIAIDQNGDLTVPRKIIGQGSQSNYGAITVQGYKNGYSGINFRYSDTMSDAGTLMMSPDRYGFFSETDNVWRWYVDNFGNSVQPGEAAANTIRPTLVVAENATCSTNGSIARNAGGLLLSCSSGKWRRVATWAESPKTVGTSCADYGPGSFAYDGSNNLLYCR